MKFLLRQVLYWACTLTTVLSYAQKNTTTQLPAHPGNVFSLLPPTSHDDSDVESKAQSSHKYIMDKWGNHYSLNDLAVSKNNDTGKGQSHKLQSATAGIFRLHFIDTDEANGGPLDENAGTAQGQRVETIKQVFRDLSILVSTNGLPSGLPEVYPNDGNNDPYVEVMVRSNTLPNGAPMPSNALAGASQFYDDLVSGITYGTVWKTINSGENPYKNLYQTVLQSENGIYHGMLLINFNNVNWNTDISTTTIPVNQNDLYSTILHEAIHMLGVSSVIDENGRSELNNNGTNGMDGLYSLYDTFLSHNGNSYISTSVNCYDQQFGNESTTGGCGHTEFSSPFVILPVYSPSNYQPGSSLSHFNCDPQSTDNNSNYIGNGFVMNHSSGPGPNWVQRFPHADELRVLSALGFYITDIYGENAVNVDLNGNGEGQITYSTQSSSSPDNPNTQNVAGINDFTPWHVSNNSDYEFKVVAGESITLDFDDILKNDVNTTHLSCLDMLYGYGTMNDVYNEANTILYDENNIHTGFTYRAPADAIGMTIFRYRPVNAAGVKGNITYIFIEVEAAALPGCQNNSCNLVCHGDFEAIPFRSSYLSIAMMPLNNFNLADNVTPDFIGSNSPFLIQTDGVIGESPGNTQYTGMANTMNGFRESIILQLNSPLNNTLAYTLSFKAYATNYGAPINELGHVLVAGGIGDLPVSFESPDNQNIGLVIPDEFNTPTTATDGTDSYVLNYLGKAQIANLKNDGFVTYTINIPAGSFPDGIDRILFAPKRPADFSMTAYIDDVEMYPDNFEPIDISMDVSNNQPCPGAYFTITYTITNNGSISNPHPIEIDISDNLTNINPKQIEIVDNGVFNNAGQLINSIPAGALAPGESMTFIAQFRALSTAISGFSQLIQIQGTTSGSLCIDPTSQNGNSNIVIGEDECCSPLSINTHIIKDSPDLCPGDEITLEVILTNNGNSDMSALVAQAQIPEGFAVSAPGHFVNAGLDFIETNPLDLAAGEQVVLVYKMEVTDLPVSDLTLLHQVISGENSCEPLPLNSTANLSVGHCCGDLFITSTVLNPEPEGFCPGDIIDFEVVITNPNSFPLNNTRLSITSSHDFSLTGNNPFVGGGGSSGSWGTYTSYTTLAAGASQVFHYSLEVTSAFDYYTHIQRAVSPESCNGYSGYYAYTDVQGKSSLEVNTEIMNPQESYCPGDIINYQVEITNPGPDISDAKLTTSSSTDFQLVGSHPFTGGIGFGNFWSKWTSPFPIEHGETITLNYSLEVINSFNSYTHIQRVTSFQTCDNPYSGVSTSTTVFGMPELEFEVEILNESAEGYCEGDIINFRATISNPSSTTVEDLTLSINANSNFSLTGLNPFVNTNGFPGGWFASTNPIDIGGETNLSLDYSFIVNNSFTTYSIPHRIYANNTCNAEIPGLVEITTVNGKGELEINTNILNPQADGYCVGDVIDFEVTIHNPSSLEIPDAKLSISSNSDFAFFGNDPFDGGINMGSGWSKWTDFLTIAPNETVTYNYSFIVENAFESITHYQRVVSDYICAPSFVGISSSTTIDGLESESALVYTSYDDNGKKLILCYEDFDGDGKKDLVVYDDDIEKTFFYPNESDGAIDELSIGNKVELHSGEVFDMRSDDMDGDGKKDIVLTGNSTFPTLIYRNTSTVGNVQFDNAYIVTDFADNVLALPDFDGDGKKDIVLTGLYTNGRIYVYRNLSTPGNLSFQSRQTISLNHGINLIDFCDFDNDGLDDFVYSYVFNQNEYYVYKNTSTVGNFSIGTEATFANSGAAIALTTGDIDGDNNSDLLVTNSVATSNEITVHRNTTNGTISFNQVGQVPAGNSLSTAIGDINNDGNNDIVFKTDAQVNNPTVPTNTIIVYENTDPASLDLQNFTLSEHPNRRDPASTGSTLDFAHAETLEIDDYNLDGSADIVSITPYSTHGIVIYYFIEDCSLSLERSDNFVTNFNEATNLSEIRSYPNPFTDGISIEFNGASSPYEIRIFDSKGHLIEQQQHLDAHETGNWNSTDFPSGFYIIECISEDGQIARSRVSKL